MFNDIRNLGAIFGVDERAEGLIAGWQDELDAIAQAIPRR